MTINEQYNEAIKLAEKTKWNAINTEMNKIANYLKETKTPLSAKKIFQKANEANNFANVGVLGFYMWESGKFRDKKGTETRKYIEIDEEGRPIPNTIRTVTKRVTLYSAK